jgi:truncated hemoglobin YjbI
MESDRPKSSCPLQKSSITSSTFTSTSTNRVVFQFESKPSDQLYVKLGGEKAIDTFAEAMYELVTQDTLIGPFFKNLDIRNQTAMFSKFLQHIFGRRPYNGTKLRAAHQQLGLKNKHFNRIILLLGEAMGSLGVPSDLVREALEVAMTTRGDICGKQLEDNAVTFW